MFLLTSSRISKREKFFFPRLLFSVWLILNYLKRGIKGYASGKMKLFIVLSISELLNLYSTILCAFFRRNKATFNMVYSLARTFHQRIATLTSQVFFPIQLLFHLMHILPINNDIKKICVVLPLIIAIKRC